MNISLVAVNAKYSHSNLALLYMQKSLSKHFNKNLIRLTEWDINRPKRELLEILCSDDTSHFFFSTYIWNAEWLQSFIPDLAKLKPQSIICCGGPEAVYNYNIWRQISGLDYIIKGNAEDTADVITSLTKQKTPEVLEIRQHSFKETKFPYTAELLSSLKGSIIYYEASRGCKFNCSYCLSAAGAGKVDYRTSAQITDEINILKHFEGTVKFVDRTFNEEAEKAHLIWRLMAENPPEGCFHFEIHPALLQDEDFNILENLKPGTAQFEIGIQSTNPQILRNVNRFDIPKKTFENIKRLTKIKGLHIHLDQIIGLPGDTPETAEQSFNDIISLQPEMFQPGFLKVLPGTPLSNNAEVFGIKASAAPPYEILESSSFSFNNLQQFHRIEKLVTRLYNSGFFKYTLKKLSEYDDSWYSLFNSILDTSSNSEPADLNCRRWDYWGRRLSNHAACIMPEKALLIKDLLRFDWCPHASAQHYPEFLEYSDNKKINKLKTEACLTAAQINPGLKKSALKRSILFIPEYSPKEQPFNCKTLFVRQEGRVITINL